MQRYFLPPAAMSPDRVHITGDDAHHLIRVMRAEPGDEVICCDGQGRSVRVRLTDIGKSEAAGLVVEELPPNEAAVEVWVAQSLPKGDKLETVLQKCTELGAAGFLPFLSERTVVHYDAKKEEKRLDRWRKIVKEAAEQSHRSAVPEVRSPLAWSELLGLVPKADLAVFCYEKESSLQLRTLLGEAGETVADRVQRVRSRLNAGENLRFVSLGDGGGPQADRPRILVIIGPEGGFSEREAEEAERAGARPTGLGSRILRTETAGLAATACILYEYGEMGG
ncbi:RsmE family RNA methyltransferase [Gorillibacterium sp. sgz500922]|uniref:RsmE family RNA methyltransferase n=1 Tax=Gorillibacterium sp. sgz500922 TaxID=3446694 RepID=UPI003F665F04